jgi:zinc protease
MLIILQSKRFLMRYFIVILAILTWIIPAAASRTHEYTLANGLKLIVKENHRSPLVISQLWYKVGSAYEPGGITGISHALEHMMFKGTPNISGDEFAQIIAKNGGELNASTSFDYTYYYEKLSAEHLDLSFKLEADRMHNLSLKAQDFAKEIQVVMEERRLRTDDNPQALAFERLLATAHIATPYHHTPIGWMSDLQTMQLAELKDWYQRWYSPNNATLVVVGDVQAAAVYHLAQRYFGAIAAKNMPKLKLQEEPPALGKRTVTIKTQAKLPMLLLGYNVPSLVTTKVSSEPYALEVLAAVLAGDQSSRLPKDLVRAAKLAVQASASYNPYQRFSTLFVLSAIPSQAKSLAEIQAGLIQQLSALQTIPLSESELDKVKNLLIAKYTYAQDDIVAQATMLGRLTSIGLPWNLAEQYVAHIQAVSKEQVQAVAKRYLTSTNLTVLELPLEETLP